MRSLIKLMFTRQRGFGRKAAKTLAWTATGFVAFVVLAVATAGGSTTSSTTASSTPDKPSASHKPSAPSPKPSPSPKRKPPSYPHVDFAKYGITLYDADGTTWTDYGDERSATINDGAGECWEWKGNVTYSSSMASSSIESLGAHGWHWACDQVSSGSSGQSGESGSAGSSGGSDGGGSVNPPGNVYGPGVSGPGVSCHLSGCHAHGVHVHLGGFHL